MSRHSYLHERRRTSLAGHKKHGAASFNAAKQIVASEVCRNFVANTLPLDLDHKTGLDQHLQELLSCLHATEAPQTEIDRHFAHVVAAEFNAMLRSHAFAPDARACIALCQHLLDDGEDEFDTRGRRVFNHEQCFIEQVGRSIPVLLVQSVRRSYSSFSVLCARCLTSSPSSKCRTAQKKAARRSRRRSAR